MLCHVHQAAPWVRAKMQKEMEAGSWRGKAKDDSANSARVKPNVLAQYREDTMQTTGTHSSPPFSLAETSGAWPELFSVNS